MAIQTMGLDYGWLVDLAKLIAAQRKQPTGGGVQSAYAGPTSSFAAGEESAVSKQVRLAREDKLLEDTRKHEITMQKLQNESPLAVALAQERGGTEQAKIGAAGQVAAAQKTTADKAKETIDLLLQMTPEGQGEFVNSLKAKRTEGQGGMPSGGTISSGGKTINLPGSQQQKGDPNDPLSWIEETYGADAETVIANLQPKTVAAGAQKTAANLFDDFQKVTKGDLSTMMTMLTGEQGLTQMLDVLQQVGESNGYPQKVIDDVKDTITGMAPKTADIEGDTGDVVEGGGIAGAIQKLLNPTGAVETPETQAGAELWKGGVGAFERGAPTVEKEPGFASDLQDFIETAFTGPFYPAYEKWKEGRAGKPTEVPKPVEAEGINEQDVITEMGTWDKEKVKAFQTAAKKAGLYTGPVDGLHSKQLDNVMKKYFKEHPEEWGEVK